MTENTERILADALELTPHERAELLDKLLSSFEFPPNRSIDELWAKEAEDRIDAYERGKINSTSVNDVFKKFNRKNDP